MYIIRWVKKLADDKKMYTILFNKITDVIEELQEVQKETEDLYIDSPEPKLVDFKPKNDSMKK